MNIKGNKRIVIWGTAVRAQITYDLLKNYHELEVIAFGDNAEKKQGSIFNNLPVIGVDQLAFFKPDYIIIASTNYINEIYKQLTETVDLPIYLDIYEFLFKRFSIDISGWCNAKCKWCSTGRKNLRGKSEQNYMSVESFENIYNHLCEIKLLHSFNEILLYSWGEPFLNPDYNAILKLLHKHKQIFSLSTNASVPQLIEGNERLYKYCKTIIFSMCGFSQTSYDRIHKFNFERIKSNISRLLTNIREHGFEGTAIISYHVYQFNEHELKDAEEFAQKLGIEIVPVKAYFASYDLATAYLRNCLSEQDMEDACTELLLDHVKDLICSRPTGYQCLVENMLSVHWDGKIELCCCCDESAEDFLWDDVFKLHSLREWQAYRQGMMRSETCNKCRALGIDYWFFNNPRYEV